MLDLTKTMSSSKPLKNFDRVKYPYANNLDPVACFETLKNFDGGSETEKRN